MNDETKYLHPKGHSTAKSNSEPLGQSRIKRKDRLIHGEYQATENKVRSWQAKTKYLILPRVVRETGVQGGPVVLDHHGVSPDADHVVHLRHLVRGRYGNGFHEVVTAPLGDALLL